MNKKIISTLALHLSIVLFAYAGTWKIPVLVDTDCAPDDYRALIMLNSIKEYEIIAITTSDGALSPAQGADRISAYLYAENLKIPFAEGRELNNTPFEHRQICLEFPWKGNNEGKLIQEKSALELITKKIHSSKMPVTFIMLGPATNLYDALKASPEIKKNIREIIWYCDYRSLEEDFNYKLNAEAGNFILNSGIKLTMISKEKETDFSLNRDLIPLLKNNSSLATLDVMSSADQFSKLHPDIDPGIWDEWVVSYLVYPELYELAFDDQKPNISFSVKIGGQPVEMLARILNNNYNVSKGIVFETFPDSKDFYRLDLTHVMDEIINKYGSEEWRLVVLTNEIHGHLGIYSIVGAKMGFRAREIFGAGLDKIKVESYAGSNPPVSCLNDGLQISTGATLGQGTISIIVDTVIAPEAIFSYNGTRLKFRLKEEYKKQVQQDISNGILEYGNLTDGYWKLIRKIGLKYWKEWDRHEIFEVEELDQ